MSATVTLIEFENSLPNGLHDAEVHEIAVDYEKRRLTLELEVWVGEMADPPERREAYKEGKLEVSGLLFLVMEQPDARYPYSSSRGLTIDGCDMSKNIDKDLLESLPVGVLVRSFFVKEWNSFIHIAAKNAEIVWKNEGAITYRRVGDLIAPGETVS